MMPDASHQFQRERGGLLLALTSTLKHASRSLVQLLVTVKSTGAHYVCQRVRRSTTASSFALPVLLGHAHMRGHVVALNLARGIHAHCMLPVSIAKVVLLTAVLQETA